MARVILKSAIKGPDEEVPVYNTRLIAAAPELLEALREFVADVEAVGRQHIEENWPDLYVTYQHAHAAISKAEGGQS